jgi:glycosyltransferase involved in cell wall biosynthesis
MADQVRASTLTKDWPVHVIPNPIDTAAWAPVPRDLARKDLGLSENDLIVMFGAGGGTRDHHKGSDLFFEALVALQSLLEKAGETRPLRGVLFGEDGPEIRVGSVPVTFLGRLGDQDLPRAYSAANVMVVPSRLDNLPSTAVEAHACATPVAAFRVGGLPDIVDDTVTGRLAEPENADELAQAIAWIVEDPAREEALGLAARNRAVTLWNPALIAEQYLEVLLEAASPKK